MASDPWQQIEALVESKFGQNDLFDRDVCVKFLEDVGGLPHAGAQTALKCFGPEPKISIRELIRFIKLPLPLRPGLYKGQVRPTQRTVLGFSSLPDLSFLVVTAEGNHYLLEGYKRGLHAGCLQLEEQLAYTVTVNASPSSLRMNLSKFNRMDGPLTVGEEYRNFCKENVRLAEVAKFLGPEELEKVTKPHGFSSCLVGKYGGGTEESDEHTAVWHKAKVKIEKDGSVEYTDEWFGYLYDSQSERLRCAPDARTSRVKSVRRSDRWQLVLHGGPNAHIEAKYPPWCLLELEDGSKFDLANLGFNSSSAVLSSTTISFHGKMRDDESIECIVSFPGRYTEGWRACVEGSPDMSVACVFLCGKEDGFGEHAVDPEDDTRRCYCHKIYGLSPRRKFQEFGYKDQTACDSNGGRPLWGCKWFQKWRDNVDLAVKRNQQLIVYCFENEVGQGLVAWKDLPTANLWDGRGLGGSQKGEVAYLKKMGYQYQMRDVGIFLGEFACPAVRID